jgi:hypothetical protein
MVRSFFDTTYKRYFRIKINYCRYAWTHGITPRKYDVLKNQAGDLTVQKRKERISFTFRKLRKNGTCDCSFEAFCDSRQKSKDFESNINEKLASELERMHVHNVNKSLIFSLLFSASYNAYTIYCSHSYRNYFHRCTMKLQIISAKLDTSRGLMWKISLDLSQQDLLF